MTIEGTVRALAELSEVDHRLAGAGPLKDRVTRNLEGRRAVLRETIPGTFLAAYDDLGRAARRPAVVPLVRGACGGCCMRVPPQLGAVVRRGQSVCSCPHCRRLLYAVPRDAESADGSGSKPRLSDGNTAWKRAKPTFKRRTPTARDAGRKPPKV